MQQSKEFNGFKMTTVYQVRYAYNCERWRFRDTNYTSGTLELLTKLRKKEILPRDIESIDELIDDILDVNPSDIVDDKSIKREEAKRKHEEITARVAKEKAVAAIKPDNGLKIIITDWSPKLLERVVEEVTRITIDRCETQGEVAHLLGISVRTLRNRINKKRKTQLDT